MEIDPKVGSETLWRQGTKPSGPSRGNKTTTLVLMPEVLCQTCLLEGRWCEQREALSDLLWMRPHSTSYMTFSAQTRFQTPKGPPIREAQGCQSNSPSFTICSSTSAKGSRSYVTYGDSTLYLTTYTCFFHTYALMNLPACLMGIKIVL